MEQNWCGGSSSQDSFLRNHTHNKTAWDVNFLPAISSVGIATRHGPDGLGIEFRCGVTYSAPVRTGPGAHPASYTMGTGSLSRS